MLTLVSPASTRFNVDREVKARSATPTTCTSRRENFAGFAVAAPYLGYVHVSEANRGVPDRGMLDWACMKAIAEIGYRGVITLKSMNHVDIAGGRWPSARTISSRSGCPSCATRRARRG